MGVLPLQFVEGEDAAVVGLDGTEFFDIPVDHLLTPKAEVQVVARSPGSGKTIRFTARSRIDTALEADYYRNGGILQTVLRRLAGS